MLKKEEILNISKQVEKVVCLGNSNTYYEYKKSLIEHLEYVPFKNLAIFYENRIHKEIAIELYKYSYLVGIEAEIYEDIDLDEFIECVDIDDKLENIVLFLDNKKYENEIMEKIKKHKIFINKNPFKEEKFKIN